MNKILAVCCSTIQLMFTVNLCHTIYKDDEVDVVIADTLKGSEKIVANAVSGKVFHNTFNVICSEQCMRDRNAEGKDRLNKLLFRKKIVPEIFKDSKYDILLFNSTNSFTQALYEVLYKNNKNLKVGYIEDGFSTYCVQGTALIENIKRNNKTSRKLIYRLLGIRLLVNNIDFQLMYEPENALWEAPFKRIKVAKIDMSDKTIQRDLNCLFNYDGMTDEYYKPIIFFEESYRAENTDIDDVGLVEKIASWVGKDNIMVKIHPRNRENVFGKLGYKTNANTEVPWEVIFMNQPALKDKLLISIASGCIATPYTMFGAEVKTISLMGMDGINPSGLLPDYYEYFRDHIYSARPDLFLQPTNENQLKESVLNFINEKSISSLG